MTTKPKKINPAYLETTFKDVFRQAAESKRRHFLSDDLSYCFQMYAFSISLKNELKKRSIAHDAIIAPLIEELKGDTPLSPNNRLHLLRAVLMEVAKKAYYYRNAEYNATTCPICQGESPDGGVCQHCLDA